MAEDKGLVATEMRQRAARIVADFSRDGAVSDEAQRDAGFGQWHDVSVGWILFAALKIEVMARHHEDGWSTAMIAAALDSPSNVAERIRHVEFLLGDLSGAGAQKDPTLTLTDVVAMLASAWQRDGRSPAAIESQLLLAEEVAHEGVRLLQAAPSKADPVVERHVSPAYVDLGKLRIPGGPATGMEPLLGKEAGTVAGVTLFRGPAALQVQLFRVASGRAWAGIRAEMIEAVRASGGRAVEWSGPLGAEVRAEQRVVRRDGSRSFVGVRFIGRDGPGWVLRGVISGLRSEHPDEGRWAYDVFQGVLVDLDDVVHRSDRAPVLLEWPPAQTATQG